MLSYRETGTARAKRSFGRGGCDQAGRSSPPAVQGCFGERRGGALLHLQEGPGGHSAAAQRRGEASGPRPRLTRSWVCTCPYSPLLRAGRLCPRSQAEKRSAASPGRTPSSNPSFTCPKAVTWGLSGSLFFQVCPV